MADYISRKVAIEALENSDADVCAQYPDGYCGCGFSRAAVRAMLKNVPAADVEPVRHGRWLEDDYGFNICSECGWKMDLEGENDTD